MRALINAGFATVLLALNLVSLVLVAYQASDLPAPRPPLSSTEKVAALEKARDLPGSESGLHHIVVAGKDWERGYAEGELTQDLLARQELALQARYLASVPWAPLREWLSPLVLLGFSGLPESLDPSMLEHMWALSRSRSARFERWGAPFARQVAYTALHEVGRGLVLATPTADGWLLARSLEQDSGDSLEREQILRWEFPDRGHAYLSIAWAGLSGAVTGVNDAGVFVAVNAAASRDFSRRGMPSTLVAAKVLRESDGLDAALDIFRQVRALSTDAYVVLDARARRLARVEKSPDRTMIFEAREPTIVANHLEAAHWANDPFNVHRRDGLASLERSKRGASLLTRLEPAELKGERGPNALLPLLRDPGAGDPARPLHAVVYDGRREILYVGGAPGWAGVFRGFDLAKSFARRAPQPTGVLPAGAPGEKR